jgi:beta-1,4-mannosyltransferase
MTTHDRVADGRPPARVLAWPAFRKQAANPYGALLAAAIRKQGVVIDDWTPLRALVRRVDLWHVHHPDTVVYPRNTLHSALGTAVFAVLLYLAHWRGIRILWTVHDLDSNDGLHPWLEAWLWRYFLPRVDAFTCLTEGSLQLARERFPQLRGVPGYTITHGHYRDAYPNEMSQEQAREALGLPPQAKVLLYFGLIRPYKNVPHLIDTFRQLKDPDLILLVVGKLYDAKEEQAVRERADGCPRVRLELRWIPPEQVQKYFAASDLVVLPYRRVLNSGAAMLALTFARPVLVPDLGNMREQQEKLGVQRNEVNGTEVILPKKPLHSDNRYQRDKKRKQCRRWAAIEPIIGHLKSDYRLSRNFLKSIASDEINLLLAATAWNLRKWLIAFLALFLPGLLAARLPG